MINGKLTTAETAKRVGIHQITLQKWIAAGRVKAPGATLIGAKGYRLWSSKDITDLLKVKEASYRKGRGRKKIQK